MARYTTRFVVPASLAAALMMATGYLAAVSPPSDIQKLAWLEGRWAGEQDGVSMEEQWSSPRGGALLGLHSDVKEGRLVSWEFFRIDTTKDGTFYFASPRSAPPTPFRLVEVGEKRVLFENRQHDFPQRILYWLDSTGALHARVEGPEGGSTAPLEWVWKKRP